MSCMLACIGMSVLQKSSVRCFLCVHTCVWLSVYAGVHWSERGCLCMCVYWSDFGCLCMLVCMCVWLSVYAGLHWSDCCTEEQCALKGPCYDPVRVTLLSFTIHWFVVVFVVVVVLAVLVVLVVLAVLVLLDVLVSCSSC